MINIRNVVKSHFEEWWNESNAEDIADIAQNIAFTLSARGMDEDAAKNLSLAWVKQIMDSMASEFGC
jgi:hypothetical protein